jgi:BirA family biotin operon repressor/biotin-[acetyl-CoA-carboxylase] ligase
MFDKDTFLEYVPYLAGSFHYCDEIVSSNDLAAELVKSGAASGTLVLAESQTKGRGRGGNAWSCPKREGLLFSLVLEPDIEREKWSRLALAAGMAVAEAVEGLGLNAQIKWPNDVWIHGRKCAGVLVEGCEDYVIVGIGINVSVSQFPTGLNATSLALEGAGMISREKLLADIIKSLFKWGSLCGDDFATVVGAVNQRCALRGEMIRLNQNSRVLTGMMKGVSSEGFLLLETDNGIQTVAQADQIRLLQL